MQDLEEFLQQVEDEPEEQKEPLRDQLWLLFLQRKLQYTDLCKAFAVFHLFTPLCSKPHYSHHLFNMLANEQSIPPFLAGVMIESLAEYVGEQGQVRLTGLLLLQNRFRNHGIDKSAD